MANITHNPDGSIEMLVRLEPEQVQILLYKYYEIDETIFDAIEEASVAQATQALLSTAQGFYKAQFGAGIEDGTLMALGRENDLLSWYMNHPETETVREKADREAQEEADRIAAEEAAEAERQAAIAAAEQEKADAEAALTA
jgi:hypothetical protein